MNKKSIVKSKDKVIGIVGGMGPQAGLTLCNDILKNTVAELDQHHLPMVLMSFPNSIVDRTAFLEGRISVNPAYQISEVIFALERIGAEVIGLACNTAYVPRILNVILQELEKRQSEVQLLHMPIETCNWVQKRFPHIKRLGLISSTGMYRSRLYQDLFQDRGFEVITPDLDFQQDVVSKLIYDPVIGIKSNPEVLPPEGQSLLFRILNFYRERAVELIILGCTELPIVLSKKEYEGIQIVSCIDAMARALIKEARSPVAAPF
ncbi:MAG: amino acid racemase [Bacteroidota bacterium]